MDLNRIVQKQIEEANRAKFDRVKVTESVKLASFGQTDLSSQPAAPTVMWRFEEYDLLLPYRPEDSNAIFALNGKTQAPKRVDTVTGNLNGGFTSFLQTFTRSPTVNYPGRTQIFRTKIMSLSERTITLPLDIEVTKGPREILGQSYIGVFVKYDGTNGGSTAWKNIQRLQSFASFTSNKNFSFKVRPEEWVTLALFVYGGYPYNIRVREAFKGISLSLDSWGTVVNEPPSAPTWGTSPLQTDYIDETIGDTKNILSFNTPTEDDWLGVGIYRTSTSGSTDFNLSPVAGNEVLRSTATNRTDFGRDFKWGVYGPTSATTQPYVFVGEEHYNANLIPDGTMLYGTANWRHTIGGGAGSDTIGLQCHAPMFAPDCLKSSADYSASGKFDMVIQSSVFAVDKLKSYNLDWYVKRLDTSTTLAMHSSLPTSALQITYYTDAVHSLCASTAYQITSLNYINPKWERFKESIYGAALVSSYNPLGNTGASAVPYFILPSDCTHMDVSWKMMHGASSRSVLYFDGANCEVASGLPTYHPYQSAATVLKTLSPLSSQESTAYGVLRIPFRGRHTDIYASHTTAAVGDNEYLSSAHWSKFAQGIYVGAESLNRVKNGEFHTFTGGPGADLPTYWNLFGNFGRPISWQATDTAIYGSTSLGLYWSTTNGSQKAGFYQVWDNIPAFQKDVTYGFWLKVDTGSVAIGDIDLAPASLAISYKEPAWWWYSNHLIGKNDQGPPHMGDNEILVDTGWNYHTIHLSTARVFHVCSNVNGTRCYIDGITVHRNEQNDGTTRNYNSGGFDSNLSRWNTNITPRPYSYTKASANSINNNFHTIRCWFTPSYDWIQKSTATGGTADMPRATIWYLGEEISTTSDKRWLYYIPFNNTDSSGGYFEYYVEHFTGATFNQMIIPSRRLEFKAMEPVHLTVSYCGQEAENLHRGQFTKLYVNGDMTDSAFASSTYAVGAWDATGWNLLDRPDNLTIGAIPGEETTTAYGYDMFGADSIGHVNTAYGQANGVIAEVRVDNYVWSEEQVIEDYGAKIPRMDPNASLTSVKYNHIVDKIRDGSEKNTITYEDTGVKVDTDYTYVLDAFDYAGNRSPFSDTASITSGDSISPHNADWADGTGYADTGYSVNKKNHLTLHWVNPTDSDFVATRVQSDSAAGGFYTHDIIYGQPGEPSQWSAGFIGYGARRGVFLKGIDRHGNENTFNDAAYMEGRTYKGPIISIIGNIFNNTTDLEDGLPPASSSRSFAWGVHRAQGATPEIPEYHDLEVIRFADHSASPNLITSYVSRSSAKGLEYNTSYSLYFTDSAGALVRPNSLSLNIALKIATAHSITAYPFGTYWSGNSTVHGYFEPYNDVGFSASNTTIRAGKIESFSGRTYFDLQQSLFRNEAPDGSAYTEISGGQIKYYKADFNKVFSYPRIIKHIPSGSINVGASNSYSDWDLGTFENIPIVIFSPDKVKTYSTAASLVDSEQFLEVQIAAQSVSAITPKVFLMTDVAIETNTVVEKPGFDQTDGGAYRFPVDVISSLQAIVGFATACGYDTATGTGPSGIGGNDSQLIKKVVMDLSWWASASPRTGQHLKMRFATMACSAIAESTYNDHGVPDATHYTTHKGAYTNGALGTYIFSLETNRVKHNLAITRVFTQAAAWKPLIKWGFCSAKAKTFGAEPAGDVTWTSDGFASSGAYYINDLKIDRITYFTEDGFSQEQTGTGVLSALVIDTGA